MGNLDHSNKHTDIPPDAKMPSMPEAENERKSAALLDRFVALDSKSLLAIGLILGALGYWGAKVGMQREKATEPDQPSAESQKARNSLGDSTLPLPSLEHVEYSMGERLRDAFKGNPVGLHAELIELARHDALSRIHLPEESEILSYLNHVIALQKAVDINNPSLSEEMKKEEYFQFLWNNPGFSEEKTWAMLLLTDPASFLEYRVLAGYDTNPERVEPGPLINPWMPERETKEREKR